MNQYGIGDFNNLETRKKLIIKDDNLEFRVMSVQ